MLLLLPGLEPGELNRLIGRIVHYGKGIPLDGCVFLGGYAKGYQDLTDRVGATRRRLLEVPQNLPVWSVIGAGDAINTLDTMKMKREFMRWFEIWTEKQISISTMRECAAAFLSLCENSGLRSLAPGGAYQVSLNRVFAFDERDRLIALVKEEFEKIVGFVENQKADPQTVYISKAYAYMDAHIEEKLLIGDVSRYLHLNPSYFSVIFKANTGKTFSEILSIKKMKHATMLINKGLSVAETACRIGFKDIGYFRAKYRQYIDEHRPMEAIDPEPPR